MRYGGCALLSSLMYTQILALSVGKGEFYISGRECSTFLSMVISFQNNHKFIFNKINVDLLFFELFLDNASSEQKDGSTEDPEDHAGLPEREHENGHDRGIE